MSLPRTIIDKIWDAHVVASNGGQDLLYIDLHLTHEVSSPMAFGGLEISGRSVRRPDRTFAVVDHNIPTYGQAGGPDAIEDPLSRAQIAALEANVKANDIPFFAMTDERNGIVHVVGPEQGLSQPGMTIVCGDSHTSTHGAMGALAFGIGTSEVEHVLATQAIWQKRPKTMRVTISGSLGSEVTAKDLALAVIRSIGTAGATGYVIEYCGNAVRDLSVEGRLTLCNMTIEAGARAGIIAPDEKILAYLSGRPFAPKGTDWKAAVVEWQSLTTDPDARFDAEVTIDASGVAPYVTWGTSPEQAIAIDQLVPCTGESAELAALNYMALEPGVPIAGTPIQCVFIGSCTNGRLEDLQAAARVARGQHVASGVRAMVVPGSGLVRKAAEAEGLDRVFIDAGFEWREPGCSMCLAMNGDQLQPDERCAATTNRNFEGRQGKGGRTHLMSPAMAAAAAIHGRIVDVREHLS